MKRKGIGKKIISITTSILLILLIFFTGSPPVNAVLLSAGELDETFFVQGNVVEFKNVSFIIRSEERIPVQFLEFSIYNDFSNQIVGYTRFYLNGVKIYDSPSESFEITTITSIATNTYGYGYNWGYDENIGQTYNFDYDYGYGYGISGFTDIKFVYDISFTTNSPGTFYAILSANCSTYTFKSDRSVSFSVESSGPPIPQKEKIYPESYSAFTDTIDLIYDFVDLEKDIKNLNMEIIGPYPYDIANQPIGWTFSANETDPLDGWTDAEKNLSMDMGVGINYISNQEKWIITINTQELWNNTNPWNQSIGSKVWPNGLYNFTIEVVDEKGNKWGNIDTKPDYSKFIYSINKIQPILDEAENGQIIKILDGKFNDTITINKYLKIIGSTSSIIQPSSIPLNGVFDVKFEPGSSNSVLENLIFDFNGQDDTRSGNGISIGISNQNGVNNIKLINNIIYIGNGSGIGGTGIQTSSNSDLSGLLIQENVLIGDLVGTSKAIEINPNNGMDVIEIYKNDIIGNIQNGITIESNNVYVSRNNINNTIGKGGNGIQFIDSLGGQTYNDVAFISNKIQNFQSGISIGTLTDVGSLLQSEINSNVLTNNDVGILCRYGADLSNSVHFNNIFGNQNFGINNLGSIIVNATYNWWGSSDGPFHTSNPSGNGDTVSDGVLFSNWLETSWGNTVFIDDSYDGSTPGWGIDHFNKTQDGIDAVFDGGFVKLNPGTYKEILSINKPLTIEAKFPNPDITIIKDIDVSYSELQNSLGQTIQIGSKDVKIKGIKVVRQNYAYEGYKTAVGNFGYPDISDIIIEDCFTASYFKGISFEKVNNLTIKNSQNLSGDYLGISLNSSDGFEIINNKLLTSDISGICVGNSTIGTIDNASIFNKTVSSLILDNSTNVTINHCVIKNNSVGCLVNDSKNILFSNNSFLNDTIGLTLYGKTRAKLFNNIFNGTNWNISHAVYIQDYYYYGQIQDAINSAGIGNNIVVYPGYYNETIIIDKELTLEGFDLAEDSIIDGRNREAAVYVSFNVETEDVRIGNLSIKGGNNSFKTGTYMGISGLQVYNCIINNPSGKYAVYIDPNQYSDEPPIRNGTLPFERPVIFSNNQVRGGLFYQFRLFELYGVPLDVQMILQNNNIDTVEIEGGLSIEFNNNDFWSLGLNGSYNINLINNRFQNYPGNLRYGLYLWTIENENPVRSVNILNNSLIGYSGLNLDGISGAGILVAGAKEVTIDSCEIEANAKGIWVIEDYININGDRCLGEVENLVIQNNYIAKGQTAINLVENVSDVIVKGNDISENGQGIWLQKAVENKIYTNTITNHYYGIRIDENSSNNLIYNNYFEDNTIQAYDLFSFNIWNETLIDGTNIVGGPSIGGNYWSDYSGVDNDSDSIGDTLIPYKNMNNIANGGDYLPLVPFDTVSPLVEVISPNGGEIYDSDIIVQWSATDDKEDSVLEINILYSDDGGTSWNLIAENESNNGEYLWDISLISEGQNYLIKIVARDLAGNIGEDESDSTFAIAKESPPEIEIDITRPANGWIYFFDTKLIRLFPKLNFILGQITITAEVNSVVEIEKVEFYIDSELVEAINENDDNLYEWEWDERAIFYHTIKIKAYDVFGNKKEESKGVLIFNLDFIP